jgi:hypothetical protein
VSEKNILRLWLESLTRQENWHKDHNVLYLLDVLAKFSMTNEDCRFYFASFFYHIYKVCLVIVV